MYNNDEEKSLAVIGEEKEERQIVEREKESEEYYSLPPAIRSRTLIWSVISILCGVLSIMLCPFYYVSLVIAGVAFLFAWISRRNLGFFEKYSIMGIIFGIMGFVTGIFSLISDLIGIFN